MKKKLARSLALAWTATLLLFLTFAGQALAQPPIPHTLVGRDDCLACHGPTGVKPVPASHAGRTNDMCRICHQPAAASPTPAATPRALGTPIPLAPGAAESSCVTCHRKLGGAFADIVKAWETSRHQAGSVQCNGCHGGDPNAQDKNSAMSAKAGYVGVPARAAIPEVCGGCHSDPSRMRQFNLPTDQLAQYRTSRHGEQLATGDKNVATCVDCHGGHGIRSRTDPESSVYPTNVPATCGTCHANAEKMKPYGIGTDQLAQYLKSVHGVALVQQQDPRAPSCASCHGNHGAVPPGFTEVANICGQCHSATQDLYRQGVHGSPATAGAPRCVTCHGQHDVSRPGDDLLLGSQPRHCGSCHPAGSAQAKPVSDIRAALAGAAAEYKAAQQSLQEAKGGQLLAVAAEADLAAANTALVQARAAQHTVSLAQVKQYTDASAQASAKVKQAAAQAVADTMNRRQIMVVVVIFAAVVALLLAYAKRLMDAGLT